MLYSQHNKLYNMTDNYINNNINNNQQLITNCNKHTLDNNIVLNIGILLPITSRYSSNDELIYNINRFRTSLIKTYSKQHKLVILIGIDYDDNKFLQNIIDKPDTLCELIDYVDKITPTSLLGDIINICKTVPNTTVCTYILATEPHAVVHVWRELALKAVHTHKSNYFVLLGDDIELLTNNWIDIVHNEYINIQQQSKYELPFGFGCVCFNDITAPNFPTFPILHSYHIHNVLHNVFDDSFFNQHADPYIFTVYNRFGASRILNNIKLINYYGGFNVSRYNKEHESTWNKWKVKPLQDNVQLARKAQIQYKVENNIQTDNCYCDVSLDVCIASYRCDIRYIDKLLSLSVPNNCQTRFILVIDNPTHTNVKTIESLYKNSSMHTISVNQHNIGAAANRNVCINHSTAEYMLFLDDDVVCSKNILHEYVNAIRNNRDAVGFVGLTNLINAVTLSQYAVLINGIDYIWTIANKLNNPAWYVAYTNHRYV